MLAGLTLLVAWPVRGQDAKAACDATRQQVDKLRKAGRADQAVAACEAFLTQFPDAPPFSRTITVQANTALNDLRRQDNGVALVLDHAQHIVDTFANSPEYYCLGVAMLARERLASADPAKRDPVAALLLLTDAIDQLGRKLPRDYYLGYNLYILRAQSLRYANQLDQALDQLREASELSPWLLWDRGYLRAVYDVARDRGDPNETLAAAKLHYVVCDFAQEPLEEATTICAAALEAAQGPGAAIAFSRSQEEDDVANPLGQVEQLELGDPAAMLLAAGEDQATLVSVYLACGDVPSALKAAEEELRQSTGRPAREVAKALRDLARCFKAHDLHLRRANQFLEFHRTGEGENPLMALEEELKATDGLGGR
jgi:tetratricopeptide (TPR) repeat protein